MIISRYRKQVHLGKPKYTITWYEMDVIFTLSFKLFFKDTLSSLLTSLTESGERTLASWDSYQEAPSILSTRTPSSNQSFLLHPTHHSNTQPPNVFAIVGNLTRKAGRKGTKASQKTLSVSPSRVDVRSRAMAPSHPDLRHLGKTE